MSAEVSEPSRSLRARVRGVLCQACDDGRLDNTLDKWVSPPEELTSAGPPDALEAPAPKKEPRKKKEKGRGLAAALALGDKQTDPDFEPSAEQRRTSVESNKRDIMPPARSSVKPKRESLVDPRELAAKRFAEQEQENQRKIEEKKTKKFAYAERQAKKLEEKKALHSMRLEYIENKLKSLLEFLVAQTSAKTARPENPVPAMIEALSEMCGKPVTAFKASPAERMKKEIQELKKEIVDLQEMYDNGDRFTADSDAEDAEERQGALETLEINLG